METDTDYNWDNGISPDTHDNNIKNLFLYKHPNLDATLMVSAVSLVLTEIMDMLSILRDVNGENSPGFTTELVKYQNVVQRYEGVEDHGASRLTQKSGNYDKLANDINMIINILKAGRHEFMTEHTMKCVRRCTKALKKMMDDDRQLIEDMETHEREIEELTKIAQEEKLEHMKTIDDKNKEIQKLRFDVEDIIIYGKLETNFYNAWEAARREQNTMICDYQENEHRNVIKDTNIKIEHENRCHEEFDKFLQECSEDLKEDINYWMKNYDEELDKWDRNVIQIKADIEKMVVDLADVKKEHAFRKQQIANWLEYKEEKRIREEREAAELEAAVVLQAWWRGIMVRKQLGPYKLKKQKKSKSKK